MKAIIWNCFILVCLHQTFTNAQFTGYGRQRGNRRTMSCTLRCPAGYECIYVRSRVGTTIPQCTVNTVAQYNTNRFQSHVTHTNTGTGQVGYGSGQRSALQALRNRRRLVQRLRQGGVYNGRTVGTHHVQPTVGGGHSDQGYGSQRQVNTFRQTTNTENTFGETATNPGNTFDETAQVGGHVGNGHVENTNRNTPRLTNNIGNTYIGRIGRGLHRYRGRSHNQPTHRVSEATNPFGSETGNPDPSPTDNSPIAKGQATKTDVNLKKDLTNGQIKGSVVTSPPTSGDSSNPVIPNFDGAIPVPPTPTDEQITGQTNTGTSSTCVTCTSNTDCTVTWEYCMHNSTCAMKVCQQF